MLWLADIMCLKLSRRLAETVENVKIMVTEKRTERLVKDGEEVEHGETETRGS